MPEPVTETQEPEAPTLTDEQVATYLGIPVEDVGKAKNVAELYKRANNTNREAVEMRKQVEAQLQQLQQAPQQMAPTQDDDEPEFDKATQKALEKFLEGKLGPVLYIEQQRRVSEIQDTIDTFHEKHASEETYSYDTVLEAAQDLGLDAILRNPQATARQVKNALETAYKYHQAKSFDVEKAAEAKAAELIAKAKEDGAEVVQVKQKKSSTKERALSLDDPDLTPDQRYKLIKKMRDEEGI